MSSVIVCLGLCASQASRADDAFSYQRNTYGETGLLEMPNARMAPDGQLSVTIAALPGTQRFNFGFQAFPWLETSFRYSHISNYQGPGVSLFDRSFGLKLRLSREDDYLPEVSVGVRDLLGTGVYSAEYLVLSKHYGDFDLTLGGGWGRLADSGALPNPFAKIFPSFATRQDQATPTGGTVDAGAFFHGPKMGVFGGLAWHSPIPNLDLLLEYSSDHYDREHQVGFPVRSPLNVGLSYQPFETARISAGWLYGSAYGLSINFNMDPTQPQPQHIGPPVPAAAYRTEEEQRDALVGLAGQTASPGSSRVQPTNNLDLNEALYAVGDFREYEIQDHTLIINSGDFKGSSKRCENYAEAAAMRADLVSVAVTDLDQRAGQVKLCGVPHSKVAAVEKSTVISAQALSAIVRRAFNAQQIELVGLKNTGSELTVYYRNYHYKLHSEAIGRMTRILMSDAPPSVEIFRFVLIEDNLPAAQVQIVRSALERALPSHATANEVGPALSVSSPPVVDLSEPDFRSAQRSRFYWSAGPNFRMVFFDPQVPLQGEVFLYASAGYEFTNHLSLSGTAELNVINNFDTAVPSNSVLPHVRTDLEEYYKDGVNGIQSLYFSDRRQIGTNLYSEFRLGYLEDMFGGGGGQILWRPDNGRWAFGADAYQVWQRDYNRLFGLQDYQTFTAHASVYYQSPWEGVNFAVHAGRYLAKDLGATFEITRRFDTGVEIGAFATFTNVPAAKFGEGSFDKGIYINIPFQWVVPIFTRSDYPIELRSITRDGGARLSGDDSLYRLLLDSSGPQIADSFDQVLQPEQ